MFMRDYFNFKPAVSWGVNCLGERKLCDKDFHHGTPSPLKMAAQESRLDVLQMCADSPLKVMDADIFDEKNQTSGFFTILGEMCMRNRVEVIEFYMNLKGDRRVDFNKRCSSGDSLFHEACRSRNVQVVKMFLDRAEELDIELNIRDGRGDTPPIMYACKSKDVMQLLLSDARIDAKATDDEGHNVLHHICHMGIDRRIVLGGVQINKPNPQEEDHVTDITILLLQSSKVPYIKDTSRGMSPLHHACDNHDKGLRIKAILEFIMERESIDVNEEDDAGRTAAHVAFGSAFRYELEDLAPQLEDLNSKILPPTLSIILEYAKKMGINLEATDNDGRTPLHHLCRSPLRRELSRRSASDPKARIETFLEVAKIQYGVEFNLNATDNDGKTPMEFCVVMPLIFDPELDFVE